MKNWYSKLLEKMTEQERNAFRVNLIVLGAVIVSLPLYVYLALQSGVWQIYAILATVVALLTLLVYTAVLIRRNRANLAMTLIVGGICVLIPEITALISGLGILLGLTLVLLPIMIGQTLSGRYATRVVVTMGVVFGILTMLLDQFASWQRVSYPLLTSAIPYIVVGALLAIGVYFVREFRNFSIQTKLLIGIIALTALSVGILAFVNYTNTRTNLTNNAGAGLKSLANSQAAAISNVLIQEAHVLQSFDLSKLVQDRVDQVNAFYGSDLVFRDANLQRIQELDQQWRAADAANNDNDPLVKATLNSVVATELREFKETFPENTEVFVTDRYGALIAATNRTSDYYQADEDWWKAAFNEGKGAIYFGQPEFDESSKTFGIILAVPIVAHGTNEVTGVMRTTIRIDSVLAILDANVLGGTGHTDLYLPSKQVLTSENQQNLQPADPQALTHLAALIGNKTYDTFTLDGIPSVVSAAQVTSTDPEVQSAIKNLAWVIILDQSQADNLSPVAKQTRTTLLLALLILAVSSVGSVLLAQTFTGRIVRLTAVASEIAGGNLAAQARVEAPDEMGTLAATFNQMSAQLKGTLDGLEQTVADRTSELEAAQEIMAKRALELQSVAEISTKSSQSTNLQDLLQTVVDLTKSSYNLYHAHIYLLDESKSRLVLVAGAGDVGRQMAGEKRTIVLDHPHSLVARAARTGTGVISNDVTKEPDFLPNPLLPLTRAEMAIPVAIAGEVLGVLDVQADYVNRFTNEDIAIKTTLAQQVATSLKNIYQYEETKSALAQSERLFSASERLARVTDLQELTASAVEVLNIPVVNRALLGVFNHDSTGELEGMIVVANWWNGTGHEVTATGTQYSAEALRLLSVFTSPTPTFFDDMYNDERVDAQTQELVKRLNVRALVGLPLFLGSRQIGTLILEAEEMHNFTQDDIRLFSALAPQIATLLESRRQFEQAQRQAEREAMLNAIGQKIQGATSVEAVLQITAREVGRAVGSKQTRVILKDYSLTESHKK